MLFEKEPTFISLIRGILEYALSLIEGIDAIDELLILIITICMCIAICTMCMCKCKTVDLTKIKNKKY